MLAIRVDESRCDRCGRCQAACAIGHTLGPGGGPAAPAGYARPLVRIGEKDGRARMEICRHCENPPCVDACFAGALQADPAAGVVRLHAQRCVGCFTCVMECPFGAVWLDPAGPGQGDLPAAWLAAKCDGCAGLGLPLCARFCPTGALTAAPAAPADAARRRRGRLAALELASCRGEPGPKGGAGRAG